MKYMISCSSMRKPSWVFLGYGPWRWCLDHLYTSYRLNFAQAGSCMQRCCCWKCEEMLFKTLMAFVTIFVLFSLHLLPSGGSCLWAGECCSAELPHPKQETQEKSPVQGLRWHQRSGSNGMASKQDPCSLSLHRGKCPRFFQFLGVFPEAAVPLKGCKGCARVPLFPWVNQKWFSHSCSHWFVGAGWELHTSPACPGTEISEEVCQDVHRRTDGLWGAHIWWANMSPCQAAQVLSAKCECSMGVFLICLSAVQHCSCCRCRCTSSSSPWDSWCHPRQLKMVVCWQINALGRGRVSSLRILWINSEIYAASDLPQHTFTHPPGIRLSFESVLK